MKSRSVIENGIVKESKHPWHLWNFPKRTEAAVVVHGHLILLVMGLTTAFRLWQQQQATAPTAPTEVLPTLSSALLGGEGIARILPSSLGSPQTVLQRYGLSLYHITNDAHVVGDKIMYDEWEVLHQDRKQMIMEEPLSATVEEYLETIYNMSMEDEVVIGARLAEKFRVAPPTVTEMLKRLVRDGYIVMDNKRQVMLTETGNVSAEAVLRRHRLTERFLVDMLGMQWHQVHEEACRLEHFISGAVEARVITTLNNPTTCPHGNPIPGSVANARSYLKDQGALRLSSVGIGEVTTILCISEVVEDEEALILYLHEKKLTPGTQLTVLTQDDSGGDEQDESFKVQVAGHEVSISKAAAAKIWVTR